MSRPTYAEIDLAAIRHNLRVLRSRLGPGVRVLGVVKADGYGHGAAEVARALARPGGGGDPGIDLLGVAIVEEGMALRVAGVGVPILVMGLAPADELAAALAYRLTLTVDGPATAEPIARLAARRGVRPGPWPPHPIWTSRASIPTWPAPTPPTAARPTGSWPPSARWWKPWPPRGSGPPSFTRPTPPRCWAGPTATSTWSGRDWPFTACDRAGPGARWTFGRRWP